MASANLERASRGGVQVTRATLAEWSRQIETFRGARERLLAEFEALGWRAQTLGAYRPLKVPYVVSPGGAWARLYFKPQSVYVSYGAARLRDARSLVSDYRYAKATDLVRLASFEASRIRMGVK